MRLPGNIVVLLVALLYLPFAEGKFEPKISVNRESSVAQEYLYLEDSPNVLVLRDLKVSISTDRGNKWGPVKGIDDNDSIFFLQRNAFDSSKVYASTTGKTHYYSSDKGLSWKKFEIQIKEGFDIVEPPRFLPNFKDPAKVMVEYIQCAVVRNDKYNSKSKVTLLVSKDGETFNAADLQSEVAYGAMNFLPSSASGLFISVTPFTNFLSMGSYSTVYASDSSGLRFKKVAENVANQEFEKIQTIDGVWLSDVFGKDSKDTKDKPSLIDLIMGGGADKDVISQISFNDGKDWNPLKVDDESCTGDDCSLHLLTSSQMDGEGKFVTGPTPGIVLGVGNTGKKLDHGFEHMRTFISRDGGASWKQALDKPCMYSFGDLGNIIVALPYFGKKQGSTNTLYYSLDQGLSWDSKELDVAFFPLSVSTTVDGTGTHFLITGLIDNTPEKTGDYDFSEVLYSLDFSEAYDKKCSKDDFEQVYARVAADDKKPLCMYGHREKFKRRKAESKCFAATLYEDVTVYDESCDCSDQDFECAPGFKVSKKGGSCEPDKKVIGEMCRTQKVKELSLPDKVLADGNECSIGKKSFKQFISEHKLKCSDYIDKDDKDKDKSKKIEVSKFSFEGKMTEYTYFEQGDDYRGENIIVRTSDNRLYASRTGGTKFVKAPMYEEVLAYFMGSVPGQIVLVTNSEIFFVSTDAGNSYMRYKAPSRLSAQNPYVSFHKESVDQFIWYGANTELGCGDIFSDNCKSTAYITTTGGEIFTTLREDIVKCDFVGPILKEAEKSENLIFCSVIDKESKQLKLVSTTDNFKTEKVLAKGIVGYAISGNYVIVGAVDDKEGTLTAMVTVDGSTFAKAAFPRDLNIDIKQAFTVLDAATGSIFMHVTTQSKKGDEYGAILKSNSNGTSYALTLDHVNRNTVGFVDYDRIQGIEGILVANVVSNYKEDSEKKLKTMISHNDGGEWNYIEPPTVDSKGKKYKCGGKTIKDCSLNLHSFTERADYRDTFSSPSAIGIMIGIGNVGSHLTKKSTGDTFLTRDGGLTWKEIKKGAYMWEYGDRGSIIVLVKDGKTNELSYSLDEGKKWINFKFADDEVDIKDLATVPSDNSRKFIVFAEKDADSVAYTIDFTDIHQRQCQLDLDNPSNDDFEYWSPKHPNGVNDCLFGHEAKYLRRSSSHTDCFIGMAPLSEGFKVTKNCSCTRQDYECDYNYFRDGDNTCKLVKGLSPSDHKKEMCKNDAFQYFEPTGYRKIPLSTCQAGKQFDAFVPQACPGKTKQFNEYYGRDVGIGKLLLIIGIPLAVFIFATWFVYDRGIRRNGGFKQLGQIRLDDDELDFHPIENNSVDKAVNSVVRGGIFAVAVVIATFKTLRKVDKAIFERVVSQVFGGGAGRRNYVSVPDIDNDEEELFGNFRDNYDDELEHGDTEDFHQQFSDNLNEDNGFDNEPAEIDSDARLFDIDDQSDEEPSLK
ncbi:Oligoxyloglucan reducing end-specific cellobiohydrolase [Yamadazyma tenuis ATCC 10573]|uniref:Oligoxyloglucan reducing end-specific cellobiohydrolase n=1 Tax=Candida tenuis (strain ATCC 10573 / BCRC 21748 / CBS 615 / JCM 9827 / NBRC 10315 / NRRL Y-1498 / VKM Y-70) TaxID=590646 RepID=G3BBQ4_CANTC|nr:Oligoxyloglucan reducing end-specific cellobiohydrolase [Yamadazyma tenuis ATCC 10573]EGV62208.1 Oligoxyloglucan reducing end-specific cellobiohydrolase [Yamadazyma tenuis ATCC 10573]